jgi:hypothetical protein
MTQKKQIISLHCPRTKTFRPAANVELVHLTVEKQIGPMDALQSLVLSNNLIPPSLSSPEHTFTWLAEQMLAHPPYCRSRSPIYPNASQIDTIKKSHAPY